MDRLMLKLVPFREEDFDRLIQWVNSKEDLVQFAGPIFTYPLTHDQLKAYLQEDKRQVYKVVLPEDNEVIGHCEINLTNEHPRLSRLLIGDLKHRGKGYGQEIVKQMIAMISKKFPKDKIDLNVFSWNEGAIRCYEKVGFEIIPENTDTLEYEGITWTRLNMKYTL